MLTALHPQLMSTLQQPVRSEFDWVKVGCLAASMMLQVPFVPFTGHTKLFSEVSEKKKCPAALTLKQAFFNTSLCQFSAFMLRLFHNICKQLNRYFS